MKPFFRVPVAWRHALAIVMLAGATLVASDARASGFNVWTSEYRVSQRVLQTAIAAQFPRKLLYLEIVEVNLSHPRLMLDAPNNRLVTTIDAQVGSQLLMPRPIHGTISLSSRLKYDVAARAVRLDAPAVEKIAIVGVSAQAAAQLNAIGNAVAEQMLKDYPVYTFTPAQLEMNGRRFEPGAITVDREGLTVEIKLL